VKTHLDGPLEALFNQRTETANKRAHNKPSLMIEVGHHQLKPEKRTEDEQKRREKELRSEGRLTRRSPPPRGFQWAL
jgi:hypothetical protein